MRFHRLARRYFHKSENSNVVLDASETVVDAAELGIRSRVDDVVRAHGFCVVSGLAEISADPRFKIGAAVVRRAVRAERLVVAPVFRP